MRNRGDSQQPCKRAKLEKRWTSTEGLDISDIIDSLLMPAKERMTYTSFSLNELETAETMLQHLLRECPKLTQTRSDFARFMLLLYDRIRQT